MSDIDFHQLVQQLGDADSDIQQSASSILLRLDEDAVAPLVDQYYAGVTEQQAIAILDIIAHIGGFEALALLRNEFHFSNSLQRKQICAKGLLHNRDVLSADEIVQAQQYLGTYQ